MKSAKGHYFNLSIENKLRDESIVLSISELKGGVRKFHEDKVINPGDPAHPERFDETNKKELSISCEKGNKKIYYIKEVVTSVENQSEVLRETISAFNGFGGIDTSFKIKISFPTIPDGSGDYHALQTNHNVSIGDKEP